MKDFGAAFWEASRVLRAHRERVLQAHGVHAGQNLMLDQLWREDGLTPGELAARIGVETPTVTRMAQRMERAGLVRRVKDTADRRLVRVHLTAAGQGLRTVLPALIARADGQALDGFGPAERERFAEFLGRLAGNLERAST
ncbi:MAG TPA: MarR family transcriptional regulator [Chloroflexota bacterium]|jgi:DNA-binding MarR family transcriptional regulator